MIEMLKHPPQFRRVFDTEIDPLKYSIKGFWGLEFEVYPYHVDEVVSQISREA